MTADLPNVTDLCVIVRCCGCPSSLYLLGKHFYVDAMERWPWIRCAFCDRLLAAGQSAVAVESGVRGVGAPRAWTRRVPGLDELEAVDIVTEVESERPRREKVEV